MSVVYNLPNVTELRLNGRVLADIFSGQVTKWNDPAIAVLQQPQVQPLLPDEAILPVVRRDQSVTTLLFTRALSSANGNWKATKGVFDDPGMTSDGRTSTKWQRNDKDVFFVERYEGVGAVVSALRNSIGYMFSTETINWPNLKQAVFMNQFNRSFADQGLATAIQKAMDERYTAS